MEISWLALVKQPRVMVAPAATVGTPGSGAREVGAVKLSFASRGILRWQKAFQGPRRVEYKTNRNEI